MICASLGFKFIEVCCESEFCSSSLIDVLMFLSTYEGNESLKLPKRGLFDTLSPHVVLDPQARYRIFIFFMPIPLSFYYPLELDNLVKTLTNFK
jgi:hypothetical protein